MSTEHNHAIPANQNERSLWWALGLTSSFLLAEVVAGLLLNSLALLADAALGQAFTAQGHGDAEFAPVFVFSGMGDRKSVV